METRVVIIGGGITGLSTAFRLKQRAEQHHLPLTCSVIEATHRFGGKIRTDRHNGLIMETGPDSILARRPAGMQLIRDLGIEAELVNSNDQVMGTYILHKDQLIPMPKGTNMGIPASLSPLLQNQLVSQKGKVRALRDLFMPATKWNQDVSVGQFLKTRLGDEWVQMMCEPLLAGIHAADADELSLTATYPHFKQLADEHRSLILGSAKQMKARKQPRKSSGRSAFVTLRDGLQTLIERLYDCLHDWADLYTESSVQAIERTPEGTYRLTVHRKEETMTVEADAVVVTTPADTAAKLFSSLAPAASEQLEQIPYVSTATVILGFQGEEIHQHISGSGFLVPRPERKLITACTYMSNKWPHTTTGNYSLIRCYVGRRGQEQALQMDDENLVREVQQELSQVLKVKLSPAFSRVTRWTRAMPQYLVGHLERVGKAEQILNQRAPGVFIAGGAYHGVGIPDCIGQAQHTAEQVLSYLQSHK